MTDTRIDLAWPTPGLNLDDDAIAALYRDPGERWLRVNFVSSIDGAATRGGLSGGLSSATDKRVFDLLRRSCDVVMVGAGTVREEGYRAMRLDAAASAWRGEQGLPQHPVFAIVSGSGDLDLQSAVFTDAPVPPIVVTTPRAPAARLEALGEVAELIVCGDDGIDPVAALAALAERGLTRVLCEGGPTLFGALLASDVVDELCITINPTLEAGSAPRITTGTLPQPRGMRLAHTLVAGDTLLLRYVRAG